MNRGYQFGRSSLREIDTLCEPLRTVCYGALSVANERKLFCPDFSIIRGFSSADAQRELYLVGRQFDEVENKYRVVGDVVTNCDGVLVKSEHQILHADGGAMAFDFACWIDGKSDFSQRNMLSVCGCFFSAASFAGVSIGWGGSYQSIADIGHFYLMSNS